MVSTITADRTPTNVLHPAPLARHDVVKRLKIFFMLLHLETATGVMGPGPSNFQKQNSWYTSVYLTHSCKGQGPTGLALVNNVFQQHLHVHLLQCSLYKARESHNTTFRYLLVLVIVTEVFCKHLSH